MKNAKELLLNLEMSELLLIAPAFYCSDLDEMNGDCVKILFQNSFEKNGNQRKLC